MSNGGCEYKCVNEIGSYQCECLPGFRLRSDGLSCESEYQLNLQRLIKGSITVLPLICCADINECAEGSDNCTSTQNCRDNDGSFECPCKEGFKPSKELSTCIGKLISNACVYGCKVPKHVLVGEGLAGQTRQYSASNAMDIGAAVKYNFKHYYAFGG